MNISGQGCLEKPEMAIDRRSKDRDKQLELKFPEKKVDTDNRRNYTDKADRSKDHEK